MKINDKIINDLFNYSFEFIQAKLNKYEYSLETKQLLNIIIPAFIIKYGFENKNKIFRVFEEVPVIFSNQNEKIYQAFYTSLPIVLNEQIKIKKYIVIHRYIDKPLLELVDNIIHEYNHALNSIVNEIKVDDSYIYIRTGLMYCRYSKLDISNGVKDDSYIIEEIINTRQTEIIMDIINSFKQYNIYNDQIILILKNIKMVVNNNYLSEAYLFQSTLCKELMTNETFINVMSGFRFSGNIDEAEYFFDNITGIDNSYSMLISILNKSVEIEDQLSKTKFFKRRKIEKAIILYNQAKKIIDQFNYNYHYK